MNSAFSSSGYCPCSGRTANGQVWPFGPVFSTTRKFFRPKIFTCLASIATSETQPYDIELEDKKHILLSAIEETQRGLSTTADQRSSIEESLGEPFDLVKLDGTWCLKYTSAPDVLVLLEAAARLLFFQIPLQDIIISEELQALIAPAILPRSFISLQILQFLRTFKAQIPVRQLYYLYYLDNNLLLGRAVGGGGVFVFSSAQSLY